MTKNRMGGLSRQTDAQGNALVCADEKTEQLPQAIRLGAGLVGGPFVIALAVNQKNPSMRTAGILAGVLCSSWNLYAWNEVNKTLKGR
jgi:hypothetical protein